MSKASKKLKNLATKAKKLFQTPENFRSSLKQPQAVQDHDQVDRIFENLRLELFDILNIRADEPDTNQLRHHAEQFFAEYGWIDSGSRYFYIQPINHKGWLIERSGLGWLVSLADKVVSKNQFMRHSEPAGIALVYQDPYLNKHAKLPHPYRIATSNDSLDHTSFTSYLKILADQIRGIHKGHEK